jgi:hypothetical protein
MRAVASVRNATSSIAGGFRYALSNEITSSLTVSTPHHYLLQFVGAWGDTFKESGI